MTRAANPVKSHVAESHDARGYAIIRTRSGKTATSWYDDRQAILTFRRLFGSEIRPEGFAASLYKAISDDDISFEQMKWIHVITCQHTEMPKEKEVVILKNLVSRMNDARKSYEKAGNTSMPSMRFKACDEFPSLRIECAQFGGLKIGSSKYNAWRGDYGTIDENGVLHESRWCPDNVIEFLKKLDESMDQLAIIYGKKTAWCCFCGRRLGDDRSTFAGYGPICAEHFGLPWGMNQVMQDMLDSIEGSAERERMRVLLMKSL